MNEAVGEDIPTDTKLDIALAIMTKEQYDAWERELCIIQLQCSVMDAKKALSQRDDQILRLEKELDTAQKLLRGEK